MHAFGQTTMLYLYVNSVFTFTRVLILWNVNILLEESLEKRWIIRQDAKEMDGTGRGMNENEMKMSKPSFSQSSEIFSCVCSSGGKWLETKTTESVKSKWLNQLWIPYLLRFSALTDQKGAVYRYLSTYFRGSKWISCPCLCPSSCSWGRCQLAPLKEGKGLHLVYIPASNPWTQKKNNEHCCTRRH